MCVDRRQLLKLGLLPISSILAAGCGGGDADDGDDTGFAPANGARLYYVRLGRGRGTPVVFMHGGLGFDHQYFRPWVDALASSNEVIYYDHLGHGRSDRPADFNEITLARLSSDCDALTTALGISRFILVGHSYGGFVAQDFALRFPNRLSGLVLSCTAATLASFATRNPLGGTSAQQTAFAQLFVGVSSDQHLKATWEAAVPLYYNNAVVPASVSLTELGARTIYSAAGYIRGNEILAGFDTTSRLHEISAPTMVHYGAGDIWRFGDTDVIARNIPDSLLQYFATSGHWPFQEQPDAFIAGLRGFAARVRG